MAMLAAYFDESGTHANSPVVAVAGYVAPVSEWLRFENEWRFFLKEAGVDYFRMSEFENRQGPFANWNKDKRIDVLTKLLKTIQFRIHLGVGAATVIQDFEAVAHKFNPPCSAYAFSIVQCLNFVGEWADECGHTQPIAYYFENGAGYNSEIDFWRQRILNKETTKRRYRFGSLTVIDKRDFPPLQAADILAYESYKEMCNFHLKGETPLPLRKSFELLGTGYTGRYRHGFFDKRSFESPIRYQESV